MDRFAAGSIQTDTRKTLAGIGTRVDGDPVPMEFDIADNRVSVDDDGAVIASGLREIVPDAHQVFFPLPVDGHAGPYAGMHEQIVSAAIRKRGFAEHGKHMIRHRRADALAEVETVFVRSRRLDAKTFEESEATMFEPDILRHRIPVDAVEQQILMIAFEQANPRSGHELVGEVETGRAVRSAIDDIAEQDELYPPEILRPVFPMRDDLSHQRTEQIVTTVNVSDSVDTLARSRADLPVVSAQEPQHIGIMAQGLQNVR